MMEWTEIALGWFLFALVISFLLYIYGAVTNNVIYGLPLILLILGFITVFAIIFVIVIVGLFVTNLVIPTIEKIRELIL